ncbi:MAG: cellulase family glycosylhydrolase [Luteolibacter sp.]|jgi:hypothetical protein|nr:cellulase family glycosylhydrolase [Luteolibacter sp.]
MTSTIFRGIPAVLVILCGMLISQASTWEPIRAHPQNPYIFKFRGQATLLRTFGPNYDWIFTSNLSAIPHLNVFQRDGMNLTRVWAMGYPAYIPAQMIQPWPRSTAQGTALDGLGKWDLSAWDEAYFTRLKDFVQAASDRGIVVELTLFSVMYPDTEEWQRSPFHPSNNVQGYGSAANRYDCFRVNSANALLIERQKAAVRRIVSELNGFDNVYYEIQNEPFWNEPNIKDAEEVAFHHAMLSTIREEEDLLPNRHMVAHNFPQQIANLSTGFDVLNEHYPAAVPSTTVAGAEALLSNHYSRGRILALDETNTTTPIQTRLEAWMFFIGGGAVYNGLDYAHTVYTQSDPAGDSPHGNAMRGAVRNINTYMSRMHMVALRRDLAWVTGGKPAGATLQASSSPGQQYVAYLHHGQSGNQNFQLTYNPIDSTNHNVSLNVTLPEGSWRAVWTRPFDLAELSVQEFTHAGGSITLNQVTYQEDLALRIDRTGTGNITPPPPVSGVSAVANPAGTIVLTWDALQAYDLASYRVYRSASPDVPVNPGHLLAEVPIGTTGFTDQPKVNNVTYYYMVTAVDLQGNESYFSLVVGVTSIVPYPQLRISGNPNGGLKLEWPTASSGWYLQESPDLSPGSWVHSPLVPVMEANLYLATFDPTWQSRFFRLILQPPPPPRLQLGRNEADQWVLQWPMASVGWRLQESPDLTVGSWTYVTLTPTVVGDQYQLIMPANAPSWFFRFVLP